MARNAVNIKGTRNGLIITFDAFSEFEEIKKNLRTKIESAGDFLKGAKLSFFHDSHPITDNQKSELAEICQQYGLTLHAEATLPKNTVRFRRFPEFSASPATEGESALLIKRNLRSGQQVVFNKHIIVLGDVHPGAEIVADGNVLVMGCCRGSVHAGAKGDHTAYVIAYRLFSESLRIADVIGQQKNPFSSQPLIARIVTRNIVFKPLNKLKI